MSSDRFVALRKLETEVSARLEAKDSDWVIVDEFGCLCLKALPGQMIKIRDDQVMNNAGGFVFAVSDEIRVRRFLILGCTGGTYYSKEKELTLDNVEALKDIIHRGKASMILHEIREISLAGRNAKQDPVMLALALCARYKVCEVQKMTNAKLDNLYAAYLKQMHKDAMALVNEVCRIPTHLFMFVKFCEMVSADVIQSKEEEIEGRKIKKARRVMGRGKKGDKKKKKTEGDEEEGKPRSTGWGRLMKTVIAQWYTSKTPEQIAMHVTKYAKRDGWSHRDLFRLSHPVAPKKDDQTLVYQQLFRYVVKGDLEKRKRQYGENSEEMQVALKKYKKADIDAEAESKALGLVAKFISLNEKTPEEEVAEAIKTHGLVREHIPTQHLNSPLVWTALLQKMPMTALIRNLAKVQTLDLLKGELLAKVCNQLTDEDSLKKARVHPIQILLAKAVYDEGHGDKGSLTWKPDLEVSSALEKGFYRSFVNVPATGKRFCLAFDVSGSMTQRIMGTCISARTASAAIGLNLLKVEKDVQCVGFCDDLVTLPYNGDWTLQKVSNHMDKLRFGMTNCALPMQWAMDNKKQFDVFVVFTDNETYHGDVHPYEALRQYREKSGIDARLIVAGMTASNFTIADPNDAGMLDVVGFDSAVPELIHNFVLGQV